MEILQGPERGPVGLDDSAHTPSTGGHDLMSHKALDWCVWRMVPRRRAGHPLGLSPSLPVMGWLLLMIDRAKGAPGPPWDLALCPSSPRVSLPTRSQPFNHIWLDCPKHYLSSVGRGREDQPGSSPPPGCLADGPPQAGL